MSNFNRILVKSLKKTCTVSDILGGVPWGANLVEFPFLMVQKLNQVFLNKMFEG